MRLVPHLMANFAIVSGTNTAPATIDDESLDSVAVVGGYLDGIGRWSDGYEIRAFHFGKLCERVGTEHSDTLTSMNNLATVLRDQGKYEQAESKMGRARAKSEEYHRKEGLE
jgi:hypothetical protein